MKKFLSMILCFAIITSSFVNVFANDLKIGNLLSIVEVGEIGAIQLYKDTENGQSHIFIENADEAEKFYNEFKQLSVKPLDQDNSTDKLQINIRLINFQEIIYESDKGITIKSGPVTSVLRYAIDYDELMKLLERLNIEWSLPEGAEQTEPEKTEEFLKTYEIEFLNKNGIILGDPDGDLRVDDNLTRAEFTAILCRVMGCEPESQTNEIKEKYYFSDVPSDHWAAGYVNFAHENKAINGFPDGNFYPEEPVTNEQVIKMLVAAWGYGDEAEENGGYPEGYISVANELGILNRVIFDKENPCKRWVASAFAYGIMSVTPENEFIKQTIKTELIENGKQFSENR